MATQRETPRADASADIHTSSGPSAANAEVRPEVRYDPAEIETRWQARWAAQPELYAAEPATSRKPKYYVLEMLPYPSGTLAHRPRAQLLDRRRAGALQVDARLQRAASDGLGCVRPAGGECRDQEQDAAARVDPVEHRGDEACRCDRLGLSYDWATRSFHLRAGILPLEPVVLSCDVGARPGVSQEEQVNWCPECATVLANEQVVDGCCWRHEDTPVEQRELEQWFLRTTRIRGGTAGWTGQAGTAGRSAFSPCSATGSAAAKARRSILRLKDRARDARLHHAHRYDLRRHVRDPGARASADATLSRRKTRSCAKQVAHDRRAEQARESGDVGRYREGGVFTGHYAMNPFSGERCRSGSANFVLMDYGTGAIMAVPAHDERDFEFCTKYGIADPAV